MTPTSIFPFKIKRIHNSYIKNKKGESYARVEYFYFSSLPVFLLLYVKESASSVEETVGQNRMLGATTMPFIKDVLFLKGWKFPYSPSPKLNVL
ncbi:MAG: hypothetical protein ACI9DK_002727 [Vicingaceae bacterium]|jgi:hypothetical protein